MITGVCLAVSIFIVQVPKTPAPLSGAVGWDPRVTVTAPLECVSGMRITGKADPGVKLTIWSAVESYDICSFAADTVSSLVFISALKVKILPTVEDWVAGFRERVGPLIEAFERIS